MIGTCRQHGTGWVSCGLIACFFWAAGAAAAGETECVFIRGDIQNRTGEVRVDMNDALDILAYLYLGVAVPDCVDAADVNDNGLVEPSDSLYLINFLSGQGPEPPPPFPEPGSDPTPGTTVPDERDPRFSLAIGGGAGVPSNTGIEIPITLSTEAPIRGLQVVLGYNRRDPRCPDLLIQEMRTEENTLMSQGSADYIIAEFDNSKGVAFIASVKDLVDPFHFDTGEDPTFPAGEDQLIATLVVAIASCADMGVTTIGFEDGLLLPDIDPALIPGTLAEGDNLMVLDDSVVRPVFGEPGVVEVRRGFIRGDGNKDDQVNIGDPIFLLDYLFRGGPEPACMDAADANNDTALDIGDPIWLLSYLFQGGPQPSEPFPQAGVDPSDDGGGSLGCESDR